MLLNPSPIDRMQRLARFATVSYVCSIIACLFFLSPFGCTPADDPSTPETPVGQNNVELVVNEPTPVDLKTPASTITDGQLRGGIFRLGVGNLIVADPAVGDSVLGEYINSHWVISEIYSGLTKIVDDIDFPVQNELAERYSVDESGKTIEFVLRQNLKFSDGSPVTASDFKWSWERALHPRTRSARAATVLGSIEGASEILDGSATELSGAVVVDERVLRIILEEPRADFLALMADPVAVVLKEENVENWGVDWGRVVSEAVPAIKREHNELPVGTGPFKLESVNYQNGPWVLSRNENYHDRPPYLESVEIITDFYRDGIVDGTTRIYAAFENRTIDMMYPAPEEIDYQEVSVNGPPASFFLVFNTDVPPFDDVHFRRSLALATDIHALEIRGGRMIHAHSIVPPGFPGFNELLHPLVYDPDRAREEFALSRYAEQPPKIEFNPLRWGFLESEFQQVSGEWYEILGIEARYQPLDVRSFSNTLEGGSLQIMGFKLTPTYPGPNSIFEVFNDTFDTGAKSTEANWVTVKLREANIESDAARRLERYAEIEQYLIDQAIVLPIGWDMEVSFWSLQTWVNGFHWPRYGGSKFKDVWFDETAPERELPLP